MRRLFFAWFAALFLISSLSGVALASVGVGVGTGKIDIKDKLRAGGIYTLPAITVYNTGTQEAEYSMSLTLNERQHQLKPSPSWLSFSPSKFTLKPRQTKVVVTTLKIPVNAQNGSYFGYLEAHPDSTVKQGKTTVGVAAATKLSYQVVPYNIILASILRVKSLYVEAEPWSQLFTVAFILTIIYRLLGRRFKVQISKT